LTSIFISVAVGVLTFGFGMLGLYLKRLLPERHMSSGSREMIGGIIGLVSLLLALVLGTLVGSAYEEVMRVPGNDHSPPQPTISQRFWDVISSSTFVGLLVFLGSLIGIGVLTWVVVTRLNTGFGLPVLALSSVLLLLAAPLVFTTLIHLIGLSDPKSAVGLPEGSSRALLALALLGLFAVMASSVLPGPNASGQLPDEFGKQMLTLVGT
jgi:hypothetical protein